MLTLFLRCNEVGMLYGARTNFRLASRVGILSDNNLTQSMLACAYAADETEEKFTNSKLGLTFYSLVKCRKRFTDTPIIGSIAKEDVKLGKSIVELIEVQIPQASAKYVTEREYLKVAYILNLQPRKENPKVGGFYDYHTLLGRYANEKVNTLDDFENFVHAKLKWEFFEINKEEPLSYAMWRLRSFFQVLTGVGVSLLEGSHRLTLAAKLLTGIAVDLPLPVNTVQRPLKPELPQYSKLYNLIYTDVLVPKDVVPGYITPETVKNCKIWSENIAKKKTHFIHSTWKEWLAQTMETLNAGKNVGLTEQRYIDVARKGMYGEILMDVAACVAESLVTKMPAKAYAQKGKRIRRKDEPGIGNSVGMDPEGFKAAVVAGKGMGFTHNWFNRVRWASTIGKLTVSKKRMNNNNLCFASIAKP
jgi:hypothetical protein